MKSKEDNLNIKLGKEDLKAWTKDLKEFYDTIAICKICKREYGLDKKKDNGLCPICDYKLKQKKKDGKNR